jgi:hypothetical protein
MPNSTNTTVATNGNIPMIIGVAGRMGSGKDTVAKYLVDIYGYTRVAFADGVRAEAAAAIYGHRLPPDLPREIAEGITGHVEEVYAKPTTRAMRAMLQWWGTEYRRLQDPNYWLKDLRATMLRTPGDPHFVVSDLRYENEAVFLREFGAVIWRVEGREVKNEGLDGHISERLEGLRPDAVIDNSGRLEDLYFHVDEALAA